MTEFIPKHKRRANELLEAYKSRPLLLTVWEYKFLTDLMHSESCGERQFGVLYNIEKKAQKLGAI